MDPDINPAHITAEETLTISSLPRSSHVTDTDSSYSDPPDADENTDVETMSHEIGRRTWSHCDYGSNYDQTKDKCVTDVRHQRVYQGYVFSVINRVLISDIPSR